MLRMVLSYHMIEAIIVGNVMEETFHKEHVILMSHLKNHGGDIRVNLQLRIEGDFRMMYLILLAQAEDFNCNIKVEGQTEFSFLMILLIDLNVFHIDYECVNPNSCRKDVQSVDSR